jgi:hypothetical protein
VTVVGTGSYTRADGTTGILADSVFATGSRPGDEQQRAAFSAGSSVAFAGAVAAAALLAEPLHAEAHSIDGSAGEVTGVQHNEIVSQVAGTAASEDNHALAGETAAPLESSQPVAAPSAPSHDEPVAHDDISGANPIGGSVALTQLPQDAVAPDSHAGAEPLTGADTIGPVSAAMLQAAMAGVGHHAAVPAPPAAGVDGHASVELAQVLADALAGDSAHTPAEALLSAIATQGPAPAIDTVLGTGGFAEAHFAAFQFMSAQMAFGHEAMLVHQDAPVAAA